MTPIQEGFDVFVHDGEKAFGAVRRVSASGIVVYVENSGDFEIPMSTVKEVQAGKVVLDPTKMEHRLRKAIGHIHDGEDPKFG